MSFAKVALVSALAVAALAGCGAVAVKPAAVRTSRTAASRGRIASPVGGHVRCLRANDLAVHEVDRSDLIITGGVRVHFAPTAGGALADQIEGRAQGAEVIGAALLYPGTAPDSELTRVENCLAQGVSG